MKDSKPTYQELKSTLAHKLLIIEIMKDTAKLRDCSYHRLKTFYEDLVIPFYMYSAALLGGLAVTAYPIVLQWYLIFLNIL